MSSSIETTARQISHAFQQSGHVVPLPSALLTKISHLSESLHLSPKELVDAWEAHSLTKNVDSLDEASYGGFRLALSKLAGSGGGGSSGKKKGSNTNVIATTGLGKRTPGVTPSPMAKRATSTTPPAVASSSSSTNSGGVGRDGLSAIDNLTTPSGKKGAHTASVITPIPHNTTTATTANNNNNNTTSIKYTERTNAGEIVSSYNPHNLSTFSEVLHSSMKSEGERKELMSRRVCSITVLPRTTTTAASSKNSNHHHQYRHMFTPLEKRSAALEHRLLDMNTAICDMYKYKSEEDEMMELTMDGNAATTTNEEDGNSGGRNDNSTAVMWTPVGLPKQNKVVCIGRICNEVRVCISFYIIFTS